LRQGRGRSAWRADLLREAGWRGSGGPRARDPTECRREARAGVPAHRVRRDAHGARHPVAAAIAFSPRGAPFSPGGSEAALPPGGHVQAQRDPTPLCGGFPVPLYEGVQERLRRTSPQPQQPRRGRLKSHRPELRGNGQRAAAYPSSESSSYGMGSGRETDFPIFGGGSGPRFGVRSED